MDNRYTQMYMSSYAYITCKKIQTAIQTETYKQSQFKLKVDS